MGQEWIEVKKQSNDCPLDELHVLPCHIDYSGPADTTKFAVSSDKKEASFRGRPLVGECVDLKSLNYMGALLESAPPKVVDYDDEEDVDTFEETNDDTSYRVVHSFDSIIVWDHGQAPAHDDPWATKLPELLKVAHKIHDS